ncbi:MAG: flavin reductase family protein [Phycisphaeraceae bacterium]|nr:MAG: flavin reductase family protein [Phycisphaeraceae bacterium]
MDIRPEHIDIATRYKLLIGSIVPRPIAVVSTLSPDGKPNLAPFSFFSGVGSNPLTLLFCPANDASGREKDTLRNCKPHAEGGTGEFVVNVAPTSIIHKVVAASEPLPHGESEFELAGLTPVPSSVVGPSRVLESPVAFECRTLQIIRTNPGAPSGGNIVIGQVVSVFVRDDAINERHHIDADVLDLAGRMGGAAYCTTRERYDVPMGRDAIAHPFTPDRDR